jgi:hypothetical protein
MKSASNPPQRRDAEAAAKALGVRLVSLDVGSPEQLGKAFEAYAGDHVDWVIVPGDALFISERERICSTGNIVATTNDLSYYVQKVLKGTRLAIFQSSFQQSSR